LQPFEQPLALPLEVHHELRDAQSRYPVLQCCDDPQAGADGKKPMASETGHDLLLLDLPGWLHKERWTRFFKRYREDIGGFLLSWLVVGFLILFAWGILQL